ncbi:hypothetical protein AB0K25_12950 [Micromonospora sp. NPDC049257]|uniref:hypothetical protein n=1 Tax=Micromonospora sp. NPDC049257 TaxID=3155771 RepID=UPI0034212ABD
MWNTPKDVVRRHEHGHLHYTVGRQEELLVDIEISTLLILLAAATLTPRRDLKRLSPLYKRYSAKRNIVSHCVHEPSQRGYVNVSVAI